MQSGRLAEQKLEFHEAGEEVREQQRALQTRMDQFEEYRLRVEAQGEARAAEQRAAHKERMTELREASLKQVAEV